MPKEAVPCEMDECEDEATHTVRIQFPNQPEEIWRVCRRHDRELKMSAVQSRLRAQPLADPTPTFRCANCDHVLTESSSPCPICGSLDRRIITGERVATHEKVVLKVRKPGKGGWLVRSTAGDDYTQDLEAWGQRQLIIDKECDKYREVIELFDGTRIESSARLSDHQGW